MLDDDPALSVYSQTTSAASERGWPMCLFARVIDVQMTSCTERKLLGLRTRTAANFVQLI